MPEYDMYPVAMVDSMVRHQEAQRRYIEHLRRRLDGAQQQAREMRYQSSEWQRVAGVQSEQREHWRLLYHMSVRIHGEALGLMVDPDAGKGDGDA